MIDVDAFAMEEAFNLLCGDLIGESNRKVFACKIDPTLVVKIEKDPANMFQNAHEYRAWTETQTYKAAADWLAPCVAISTHGLVLLQKRVEPVPRDQLPAKLPSFLVRDLKQSHFGMYEGRLVCCDYAMMADVLPVRLKNADWS